MFFNKNLRFQLHNSRSFFRSIINTTEYQCSNKIVNNIRLLSTSKILNIQSQQNNSNSTSSNNNNNNNSNNNKQGEKKSGASIFNLFKRGSKFLISTSIVLGALGISSISLYLVFTELFSPSGETQTFNRVVSMIEKDEKSLKLLGYSDEEILKNNGKIKLNAYGEIINDDRWTRNRPISATKFTGKDSKEHLLMRFFVESQYKVGIVQLEAIDESFIEQNLIFVSIDVNGEQRHYLIGGPSIQLKRNPNGLFNTNNGGFLGIKWGPKRD
ncbi:hypothetical protein B5S31_g2711 [[Candida] boidinii]|nr:hypothetical protein B5S31_g2711 [[Candida] boidinii]